MERSKLKIYEGSSEAAFAGISLGILLIQEQQIGKY